MSLVTLLHRSYTYADELTYWTYVGNILFTRFTKIDRLNTTEA